MDALISPVVLYLCLALGGVGVLLALPRPRVSLHLIGGLVAAAGLGAVFLALALTAGRVAQDAFFYVFAFIMLGSALRVITHAKPVYAALYFIMTILSSSAMYLLLQAEFMAFALIIIYAGAILITYLFVIMLATQAPSEGQAEALAEYDAYSREPLVAVGAGFLLLAVLTGMLAQGVTEFKGPTSVGATNVTLAELPRKVISELRTTGVFDGVRPPVASTVAESLRGGSRTLTLEIADADRFKRSLEWPEVRALFDEGTADHLIATAQEGQQVVIRLPDDLTVANVEGVGWELVASHPMGLEMAGVILLMAMLGAVVLARKQIELSEEEKAAAAGHATLSGGGA